MDTFDENIIIFVNQFSQHSQVFDRALNFFSGNQLLKGGVLMLIIWWAWFRENDHQHHNRRHIIANLIGCIIAMALARGLAWVLPFRSRPLHEEYLGFLPPHGLDPIALSGWSSFPSDHSVLFTTLVVGIFLISRTLGLLAMAYTVCLILLPRIYLGFHYPSDIIAGAIIGSTVALLCDRFLTSARPLGRIETWSHARASLFYPFFFLFTYQIADMFDSSRSVIRAGAEFLRLVKG